MRVITSPPCARKKQALSQLAQLVLEHVGEPANDPNAARRQLDDAIETDLYGPIEIHCMRESPDAGPWSASAHIYTAYRVDDYYDFSNKTYSPPSSVADVNALFEKMTMNEFETKLGQGQYVFHRIRPEEPLPTSMASLKKAFKKVHVNVHDFILAEEKHLEKVPEYASFRDLSQSIRNSPKTRKFPRDEVKAVGLQLLLKTFHLGA